MSRIAVVPGSFDPVTLGHVDLIRRAAALFGACRVVVMNNREKTYRFSLEERFEMCRLAFEEDANVSVDLYEGMLYEYLQRNCPEGVLVKGVRNEVDFLYEKKQAAFNYEHCGVETLYLDAREGMENLSSTLVREKMMNGEELSSYLPENIVKHLRNEL